MESLHKLVYEATIKPERFRFFVATQNPDDAVRYLLLFEVNEALTKKVIVICNEGEIDTYGSLKVCPYACFEAIKPIEADVKKAGYEPISLLDFVIALAWMSQLYNVTIDELI